MIVDVILPRFIESPAAPETARAFGADAAGWRAGTTESTGTGVGIIAQNIPVQAPRGTA
jgi:hypothetical protein